MLIKSSALLLFLLTICNIFTVDANAQTKCKDIDLRQSHKVNTLLYRIDDCNGNNSYIFGTMHSDDKKVIELAKEASTYLKQSKTAIFELANIKGESQKAAKYFIIPATADRDLIDIAGEELFSQLVSIIKKSYPKMPRDIIAKYRPWGAALLIQLPKNSNDGIVADQYLQSSAANKALKIVGLEQVEEQFRPFLRMPEDWQVLLLEDAVKRYDETIKANEILRKYYISGNLDNMQKLGDESLASITPKELGEYIEDKLIIDRNNRMTSKILPHLAKGKTFIAVGALHLPGNSGLLKQFKINGYRVIPVAMENIS